MKLKVVIELVIGSLKVGASGGILQMWDVSKVEVWSTTSMDHVLIIQGPFVKSNRVFSIANVYALCDRGGRQQVWVSLSGLLANNINSDYAWCITGDFNAIGYANE